MSQIRKGNWDETCTVHTQAIEIWMDFWKQLVITAIFQWTACLPVSSRCPPSNLRPDIVIVLARLQQREQTMEEEDAAHILSKVTMKSEFVFHNNNWKVLYTICDYCSKQCFCGSQSSQCTTKSPLFQNQDCSWASASCNTSLNGVRFFQYGITLCESGSSSINAIMSGSLYPNISGPDTVHVFLRLSGSFA